MISFSEPWSIIEFSVLFIAAVIVALREYGEKLPEIITERVPAFVKSRHWAAVPLLLIGVYVSLLILQTVGVLPENRGELSLSPDNNAKPIASEQGANYLVVGPDPWEGSPLAIAWRAAQLREPVPNSPLAKYYRFIVNARNIGDESIKLKDGYIVSSTDASRIPMLLSVPNDRPFSIDDANPVPPHAEMFLTADFPEGTSEPTLFRKWGSFSAVIEYDNKQEKRQFERRWVVQQLAGNDPAAQPHVSKKK